MSFGDPYSLDDLERDAFRAGGNVTLTAGQVRDLVNYRDDQREEFWQEGYDAGVADRDDDD